MYDIFYIGDNESLKDRLPFATRVDNTKDIKSNTKMYWLVDTNTKITDWELFDYKPDVHTENFIHVWKWNQENYGGVSLTPKGGSEETVWHNKVVCKKYFDILFEEAPGNYFEQNAYATHVWCVDKDYILNDDIDWAPGNFEPDYIHSFHLRGQLEHKYPELEGGVKLYPREWSSAETKYHKFLDANVTYPILYVEDVNDMQQRDILEDDYVWLIDKDYSINVKTVDWVPNAFEYNFVHVFKMPYQLKEKYPMQMGGIRLVPKDWKDAQIKIHKACPIEDEAYDVFYIDSDEFTPETYSEYAERSKTDWFWIVDREHTFNGKLLYVPAKHEEEFIHVFKVPGHLEERYTLDNTDAWDIRCGGVRLMSKQFDVTRHKYQEDVCPVRYDIFYADDINDYETPARKSRTKMFWLVDSEHQINEEFRYVPQQYDQQYIQVFKFPNDLEHKYPRAITNISDNRAGGIKLVPVSYTDDAKYVDQSPVGGKTYPIIFTDETNIVPTEDSWIVPTAFKDVVSVVPWQPNVFEKQTCHVFANGMLKWMPAEWNDEIKNHDFSPVVLEIEYEVFDSYDEGKDKSLFPWFWVVDKDVDVLDTFDFGFQPNVFDEGKAHVWQKLNPVTNKQYDYGGVALRHKNEKKGRPKYIREPACKQREFPVYHIQQNDIKCGLDDVYERLATQSNSTMMWIVDSLVQLDDDFDFSYYPTQYDKDVVHVWKHDGTSRVTGVKLVPTSIKFESHDIILQNAFDKLKEMPTIASKDMVWPVEQLAETTVKCVKDILESHKDVRYVYTVDPDVDVDTVEQVTPHEEFLDNVHVWQRTNSEGLVIGHGGLRLWPTDYDIDSLTDEQVTTCSIPEQLILSAVGGTQKEYPVHYLSEDGDILQQLAEIDSSCDTNMYWIVDPFVTFTRDWQWDFIPTKWEEQIVHVFQDTNEDFRSVRLVPKGTFDKQQYTLKQIVNNSFKDLKQVYRQITTPTAWPIYYFGQGVVAKEHGSMGLKFQLEQFGCHAEDKKLKCFFTVDEHTVVNKDFEFTYTPNLDNINKTHVWQRTNQRTGLVHSYGGIRLWPNPPETAMGELTSDKIRFNKIKANSLQYVKSIASSIQPFEIYCISYKEDYQSVDRNIQKVNTKGHYVQHIRGVEGIFEAHKSCAEKCKSKMFWVMDADALINDDFDFDYIPDQYDLDVVHVWASENPVTGDQYGYGGVKLFNTEQVQQATTWGLDFTTGLSTRFKSMPQVSCTTKFNTDAYSTWRSAFRETVKLALSKDPDADSRLNKWLNPLVDCDYCDDAMLGANMGKQFALENKDKPDVLNNINDYEWLENTWKQLS